MNDFVYLADDNGNRIRDTLYRTGAFGRDHLKNRYFLLIKHVESVYSDSITTDQKQKLHLANIWCILDQNGNEKVVCEEFHSPWIVDDSIVYNIDNNFYNIETGEFYCQSYSRMTSKDYVFLENRFDTNKARRGVMKINKIDGSYEIFPE